MKDAARLYARLWACATLEEVMTVLARERYAMVPVANRRNNKAPIRANRDSIAAIMEAVTNGHDAAIRLWHELGKFAKRPASVNEALSHIAAQSVTKGRPRPLVHVLVQLRKGSKFEKARAVTIVDEGIGMTAQGMRDGVLTFGSEDKVLDPTQFGSFGQGSASLFGHCRCSIIASRHHKSNTVVFTVVWLHKPKDAIHSYMYLTRPDGSLFEFDAADLPNAAMLYADPIYSTLVANTPIMPKSGTIRRQLEIEGISAYYTQRGNLLYYALMDRMFGCPAYVRLAGDDDKGHLNLRRGRAHELNSVAVGECLQRSQWRIRAHIPPSNAVVHRRSERIGLIQFETWVIEGYVTDPTTKSPRGEVHTPGRHLLEGSDRASPRNIVVTLNGQTLARLHSTPVFNAAKLREIAENIIVQVSLDYLPEHVLQDAEVFLATREGLVDWFERQIVEETKRYLEGHEELRQLARSMMPPEDPATVTATFGADINKVLTDPIFGPVLGYRNGKGEGSGTGPGDDVVTKLKRMKQPPKPIILVDPPTEIAILKETVVRNATNWLTIHTNAPDSYGSRIRLDLPDFLKQVGGGNLRDGRISIPVICDNSPFGTVGEIIVSLLGTKLGDICEVTIVPRGEAPITKAKAVVNGVATTKQGPPKTKLIEIVGPEDRRWPQYFGCAGQAHEAAFNYAHNKDENVVDVALFVEFPPLVSTMHHLDNAYGPVIARDFHRRVCQQFQISATVFCRNDTLGPDGAHDAAHLGVLTDIAREIIVSVGALYRTVAIRNAVIAGGTEEWLS